MSKKRYCLQCDDGTLLVHGARDIRVTYRERGTVVPRVVGWHCPACMECEFDEGEGTRYAVAVEAFSATVDADLAASVRAIRRKLGLKQAEAGRLFGGGVNAFSEYERGKTQPHKSTVLLLRLLERHPELLRELA